MNDILEGGLYTIGSERVVAVVIFAGAAPDLSGLDVRVIPAYVIQSGVASNRDVIVPATENSLRKDLVLACWNARQVSPSDLNELVARLPEKFVHAARATELIGIAPEPGNEYAAFRGAPIVDADDPRVEFQRAELQAWDDVMLRLENYRNAEVFSIARSQFQGRRLFEGTRVSGGPVPEYIVARGQLPTLRHALTTAGAGAVSVTFDDGPDRNRRVA